MASLAQLKGSMLFTITAVLFSFAVFLAVMFMILDVPPVFAIVATVLFVMFEYLIGPAIVSWSTGLQHMSPGENPWLESTVRALSERSGIPPPKLATAPDYTPNAFVFGHTAGDATLAVHSGLLERLNQEEIKGVIGHELGHIKHRDFIVMTMLSALPLICYLAARGLFWSADAEGEKHEKGGALAVAAWASYAIYIISSFLVAGLSRLREHYADAYSAYITGSPRSLASALTKITYGLSLSPKEPGGARMFYIADPAQAVEEVESIRQRKDQYDLDRDGVLDEKELQTAMEREARSTWANLNSAFATHPATYKRILLLQSIEKEMDAGRYTSKTVYKQI